VLYAVSHAPDIGAMPVNDKHGHDDKVDEQRLVVGQVLETYPDW
jgi:hypothetical protein